MNRWILLLHVASTGMMIGVIWFVQIVHYPMFSLVGRAGFSAYEAAHSRRTTLVVAPPMLVELATGAYLALWPPPGMPRVALWAGLAPIAVIWLSTWLLQVPRHRALEAGFDLAAHRALVGTNWIRTVAWTARGILLLVLLGRMP
jgi:disulfide bond formation protein DsbB